MVVIFTLSPKTEERFGNYGPVMVRNDNLIDKKKREEGTSMHFLLMIYISIN